MVEKIIKEATKRSRIKKNISSIGKGLSPKAIEKGIATKRGLLTTDPSKLKITVNDLLRVANKRFSLLVEPTKMGKMRNLKLLSITPNSANKSLTFAGASDGVDKVKGKEIKVADKYKLFLSFYGVDFSFAKSKKHPITVKTKQGNRFFVGPMKRNLYPVQTACTCKDFAWTFSFWDKQLKALLGQVPPEVLNFKKSKDNPRGPRNATHLPGMCKHIFKFTALLRQKGWII